MCGVITPSWVPAGCNRLVPSGSFLLFSAMTFLLTPGAIHAKERDRDMSLWIDETQVKEFSGFPMNITAIVNGTVSPYILDPNFEKYLPVIPSEVGSVNFTWRSGDHKYFYDFYQLQSFNEEILSNPVISIDSKGKVPRRRRVFQVVLPCLGNRSGIARFGIGLRIQNENGIRLPGTPLDLRLQKQCSGRVVSADPECDKKCANSGYCNQNKVCECPKGDMGKTCRTALCYPKCMNGGNCISPGICACTDGFQGKHCEGGICREKCLNGGKCVQKDTCSCRRGYYGPRCEYSKCRIPCVNGGRCDGVDRCRCRKGFDGPQCERSIQLTTETPMVGQTDGCRKKCKHGRCSEKHCLCESGWYGKRCTRRHPRRRRRQRKKQFL